MSVGRHLVEYGFFGVSPSGPIVEASSSPLQTVLYAIAYWLWDVGYADFASAQTIASTFLLGAAFALFFETNLLVGAVLASIAAFSLSFIYPFFLWHGSGMENAITHVLAVASLAGLTLMVRTGRVKYRWAVPIILLSFSRFELIVPIAVILVFFSIYWVVVFSRFSAVFLSGLVVAAWTAINASRVVYYGDIFPNTAVAQEIAPFDRLEMIISGSREPWNEAILILKANVVAGGWWMAALALLVLAFRPLAREFRFLFHAAALFFVVTFCLQALLGFPRIDITRTSSHLAPVAVLLFVLALFTRAVAMKPVAYLYAAMFMVVALHPLYFGKPYYLGWSTKGFDGVRRSFDDLAERNDLHRPLVSNPDLGVMTWHKSFNILDLGMLGSPVFAGLSNNRGLPNYFLDFARPDFIESHGNWTRDYCKTLFLDPRFAELYAAHGENLNLNSHCALRNPPEVIWVRRDILISSQSVERQFIDDLQNSLDLKRIHDEVKACGGTGAECRYIVRTIFRFIPELRVRGEFETALSFVEDQAARDYLTGWDDAGAPRRLSAMFLAGSP